MILSLDYDDTYTRDPQFWDTFIASAQHSGHTVYCVTLRSSEYGGREVREALASKVDGIFFTNSNGKASYMAALGIWIDVWIDDMPRLIYD